MASSETLFREGVAQARRVSLKGSVRLASPVSHAAWTLASLLVGGTIIGWLLAGHYTRREHVTGTLVPQAGLIDVYARAAGQVTHVAAREGMTIKAGDPLIVLSGERSSEALGDTSAQISTLLQGQRERLQIDIKDAQHLSDEQAAGFRNQQRLLQDQVAQIDAQLAIQHRQVSSQLALLEKIRPLLVKGYISSLQVQQQESQELDAEAQVKALTRQRYETSLQIDSVIHQLAQLPLTSEAKLNELHRQMAQGDQSLAQNEAERSVVLRAPYDGTVSSVLIKPGQAVSAGQALLSLVPRGSALQAQLLVPSRAIGFVHDGTDVALHYQAFPYQKFGVHHGRVTGVSRSALTPAEVTTLLGQQATNEPMYRVQVALSAQSIDAYGKGEALKPGMALDADLLLDRRRLIEWVFEPLYGMRRRAEGTR